MNWRDAICILVIIITSATVTTLVVALAYFVVVPYAWQFFTCSVFFLVARLLFKIALS